MGKIALIAVVAICVILLTVIALLFWRLRAIGSRVGSFECDLLLEGRWRAGVATYSRNHLNWHQAISLSVGPNRQFDRREFEILGRRPRPAEPGREDVSEARCAYHGEEWRLAADDGALNGLVSWLEASPPQSRR